MTELLKNELGSPLKPKEVAEYLGLDEDTVRKYYRALGGIRLGSRYLFFERRICDAILQFSEEEMGSLCEKTGNAEAGSVQEEKGCDSVRGKMGKITRREVGRRDKFGVLD